MRLACLLRVEPIPASGLAICLVSIMACSKDIVYPDTAAGAVCGNGILEVGEECDVASPGCVACKIVPDWTCTAAGCSQLCGDGVVPATAGGSCDNARRDSDCDMTGYWASRETDFTRDTVVQQVQTSSTWHLYHFTQSGEDFLVVEDVECGTHTSGTATVDETDGSLRGMLYRNRMDGQGTGHKPARHGTSKASGNGCAITFDRWYSVRGATNDYLPTDFSAKPPFTSLKPLPKVSDPTGTENPPGTEDPDGDGIPGVAYHITGIAEGIRNSAQRQWKEYASLSTAPVAAGAIVMKFPGGFDFEESVIRVTECGAVCALIAEGARTAQDLTPYLTLSFIGKTLGSERVAPIIGTPIGQSADGDLATCAKVRIVLPHEAGAQ